MHVLSGEWVLFFTLEMPQCVRYGYPDSSRYCFAWADIHGNDKRLAALHLTWLTDLNQPLLRIISGGEWLSIFVVHLAKSCFDIISTE